MQKKLEVFCLDNILTKYRGLLASQVPHPSCVKLGNLANDHVLTICLSRDLT